MQRRVVITGLGSICSLGKTSKEVWNNCLLGLAPVSPIPESWHTYADFKSKIWSPLPAIDFNEWGIPRVEILCNDPVTLLSFVAAKEAINNAKLDIRDSKNKSYAYEIPELDPARTVIFMGTAVGGITSFLDNQGNHLISKKTGQIRELLKGLNSEKSNSITNQYEQVLDDWHYPKRFNTFIVPMMMPNAVSAYLGIKYSINGHNNTVALACASGASAIGHAFRSIANGRADAALCGGSEYLNDPYGGAFRGFDVAGTMTTRNEQLEKANRPFDQDRDGFLFSEGGTAVMVLEEYHAAIRRKAPIIAEICGYGETFDSYSMMRSSPDGVQLTHLLDTTLAEAGISAKQIDYVNTHGTGTELNDQIEAEVIARYFPHNPRVNATKSLTGHAIGASGAIEAAITALSLQQQTTHVCNNLDNPIADLNFVRETQNENFRYGLTQSFAFGGHNVALVLKRSD